jgi:hypothetical protein
VAAAHTAAHVAATSTAALRKRRPGAYGQRASKDERFDE